MTTNNIEEACRNDFGRINIVIEALQHERYAIIQTVEFDQQSVINQSEVSNESHASSSGSYSGRAKQKIIYCLLKQTY